MKLKPIPQNTVVHTPTEEEAKELLAILHENGYKLWNGRNLLELSYGFTHHMKAILIRPDQGVVDWYGSIGNAPGPITLAEFKERYVDFDDTFTDDCKSSVKVEEKPQPKFKVGDKVRIIQDGSVNPDYVGIVDEIISIAQAIRLRNTDSNWFETCLEPYTESETKPTEDMETKELNLCKLIGDRDGIQVYCPTCGEVTLQAWDRGKNTKPLIFAQNDTSIVIRTFANGKAYAGGECVIFPSRAFYEQYPLDPYTAWMKWQEEQKKHWVSVTAWIDDLECESDTTIDTNKIYFRTPADRDKCIEEIKEIINKYSK